MSDNKKNNHNNKKKHNSTKRKNQKTKSKKNNNLSLIFKDNNNNENSEDNFYSTFKCNKYKSELKNKEEKNSSEICTKLRIPLEEGNLLDNENEINNERKNDYKDNINSDIKIEN